MPWISLDETKTTRWVRLGFCVLLISGLSGVGSTRAEDWFGNPIVSVTPYTSEYTEVADVTGDGIADVAFLHGYPPPTHISIYAGATDGTFELLDQIENFNLFVLMDYDRNGMCDVICEDSPFGPLRAWSNDGTGQFTATSRTFQGYPPLAVGDLDNDGELDLATTVDNSTLVYYGTPSGLSTSYQVVDMASDQCLYYEALYIHGIDIADLDGDGRNDLLVSGRRWCGDDFEPQYPFIRWRLRGSGRTYGDPRTFQYPVADASYLDFAVSPHSGEPSVHVAAAYTPFSGYHLTQLFRYDESLGVLEMIEATLPGRRPLFEDIDGDTYQDLVLTGILQGNEEWTEVWRGTAGGEFLWTQTLRGAGLGGVGQIVGNSRLDYVSVRRTSTPGHFSYPLAVWENISDPTAGVPVGDPGLGVLWVHPTVSSDRIRIELPHGGETVFGVQVTDVLGRDVRHLNFKEVGGSWDLRDETGTRVAPGVYWLRAMPRGGSSARVIVVR